MSLNQFLKISCLIACTIISHQVLAVTFNITNQDSKETLTVKIEPEIQNSTELPQVVENTIMVKPTTTEKKSIPTKDLMDKPTCVLSACYGSKAYSLPIKGLKTDNNTVYQCECKPSLVDTFMPSCECKEVKETKEKL